MARYRGEDEAFRGADRSCENAIGYIYTPKQHPNVAYGRVIYRRWTISDGLDVVADVGGEKTFDVCVSPNFEWHI